MIARRRFLALFGGAPALVLGSGAMPTPSAVTAAARNPVRDPSLASILEDFGEDWPDVMARLAQEAICPSRGSFAGCKPGSRA